MGSEKFIASVENPRLENGEGKGKNMGVDDRKTVSYATRAHGGARRRRRGLEGGKKRPGKSRH